MTNIYLIFKSFHIIGFVSWFAGLFYLVRIFVYYAEADEKPDELQADWKRQFLLMQERVYGIIATPAMIITWLFGIGMLGINPAWLQQPWLEVKLFLLILLTLYHFYCRKIIQQNRRNESNYTPFQFRLLNELPTLFLVSIVLLAVLKSVVNFFYLFGGILLFGATLYFAAKSYKNYRNRTNEKKGLD